MSLKILPTFASVNAVTSMKVFFLNLALVAFVYVVEAQVAEPLYFQDKTFDFGDVIEQNGPVAHEFTFINKSPRPIKILTVQPSCGCTTSGWTTESVAPGKFGSVKASFDPRRRPGYFNKTLSIATDFNEDPIVLTITGNVIDKNALAQRNDLAVVKGNLRFKSTSFNLGKLFVNREKPPMEFHVYNNSDDSIKILKAIAPQHITLEYPTALPPKSVGKISIIYRTTVEGKFGFCTDNVTLVTNDKDMPEKQFAVYSTIEEYFPLLTPDEQLKAPVLSLSNNQINLGKMKDGAEVVRLLKIKNRGKKELTVRHAQSNCSCLVVNLSSQKLKPNEEANIELRFDPKGREGSQNKAVTIYSTDPVNPVQRIIVKGYIDN